MATEDCKELLSSGSESEDVENDLYNDINNTATSLTNEKNGEDFQSALEDDKEVEEVNTGHETEDELGDNSAENDQKVEAIHSSSKKGTKKILRKRKKNVEDASAHTVSSPAKAAKKRINDMSPIKIKEVPPFDESTQGNAKKEDKSDDKLESIGKAEDEAEKTDGKDVKTGKKTEAKIGKKKITTKAKGGSSNAESAPTESPNVAAVEATSGLEENAKLDVESDEILASASQNSIPASEGKDAEDKSAPSTTEKQVKGDDTAVKQSKKVDGMGLIFMCNAKTKKDCFKYNVFGLPESKKALVAKIYKGMRLFLYDFDLKLLYGIYKATSPGGFNIEPKAFGSKFPSQVRFTVLRDFLPLPEEKFKAAIKDNYNTRNKFDCQLSSVQVSKLCKLFQNTTASASIQKHRPGAVREVAIPRSRREPRRSHFRIETYPSPPRRVRRLSPLPRARYPSPPRALPLQTHPRVLPAPPHLSYAYEQPSDDYYYTRDRRVFDLEMRPRDLPVDYRDSYNLYRDLDPYREPAYPPSLPPTYAVRLREPRSPPRYLY